MRDLAILFQKLRMLFEKIYEMMIFALIDERSDLDFDIFHCY